MNAVFMIFRKFGMENNPEYNLSGLWPCRSAQPVFQRYKRLKADCLRFEGEFHRVSRIHVTTEPRKEDFVRTATEKANLASRTLSASESGHIVSWKSGSPSCSWFPHCTLSPCEGDIVCLDCFKNTHEKVSWSSVASLKKVIGIPRMGRYVWETYCWQAERSKSLLLPKESAILRTRASRKSRST
jgi:hypothetical protein